MGASDLNPALGVLAILDALYRLPDEVALTTDEAAIFLRMSRSTLERLRRSDHGPLYTQGGEVGARGINQRITYRKADLIEYQQRMRVTNVTQAAIRRAQLFIAGVPVSEEGIDVWSPQPFYQVREGLVGSVLHTKIDTVIERLGCASIEWANPIAAAVTAWVDESAKSAYAAHVQEMLVAISARLR